HHSVAHARGGRAHLPRRSPDEPRAYVRELREAVLELLPDLDPYLVELVARHELQHGETMTQTLAFAGLPLPGEPPEVEARGDVLVPGGPFVLGAENGWAYDNERPAHVVELPPFRID